MLIMTKSQREREREKKLKTRLINYKMKNKKNGIEWRGSERKIYE
jgi:hypothetical protein